MTKAETNPQTDSKPESRKRRSNAERSATTRAKLIDAAIQCLQQAGYAATSTWMIAQAAKVSRGAMLHQFPSKIDLMIAVAEHIVATQHEWYTEELFKLPRGRERYVAVTRLTWEAWSRPAGMAMIEIMVAARSDPALAERFPPVARAFERRQRDDVWAIARSAGITDRDTVEASVQLNLAIVRGLSIDLMYTPDRKWVQPAVDLMLAYKRGTADRLIAEGTGRKPSALAPADADRLRWLEEENRRLKLLLADRMIGDLDPADKVPPPR